DETRDHLESLFETKSLTDKVKFEKIQNELDQTGKMIYRYIQSIENRID
ncbi:MAG: four helix bundle protein, partial [Balneolaceae bacterium]